MAIQINGSGTITGISVGGLPDGIVDTDMIATNAVATAKLADGAASGTKLTMPAGSIIQTVNIVNIDPVALLMTTSYQDVSGFSISITPTAANSKIILAGSIVLESHQQYCFGKFVRSINGGSYSSPANWLGNSSSSGSRERSQFGNNFRSPGSPNGVTPSPMAIYAVDTDHNTTNAITYKLQYRASGGTGYYILFNRGHSDSNDGNNPRSCSHLTLMEVKV